MKKILLLLILQSTCYLIYSQSVISKTVIHSNNPPGNYQLFRITSAKGRLNDGKFDRALQQNDIIGNDYASDQRISGINANHDNSHTPTNYQPVDGFKRTFCGPLHSYYYSDGIVDHDQCIELDIDKNNPLIKGYKYLYDKYKVQTFLDYVAPSGYRVRTDSNWFFEPWNIVEGEINNSKEQADFGFSDLHTNVCMYGPWVLELYDPSEIHFSPHKNNNEIHPIEQFWYKDKAIREGNTCYRMNFFVDASGRFNDKSDYYAILPGSGLTFTPWSKVPMDGNFRLAFEINLKRKEHLTYWIEILNSFGVKPPQDDGKNHFLMFGQDTLISLFEGNPENVNISFDNVGYKPLKGNRSDSSILQGFVVFSSRIIGPDRLLFNNTGELQLRVEKQVRSSAKQSLLFIVEKIKRLQWNSYRNYNPVNNTTYTDPNNAFNEKQVYISLTCNNQIKGLQIAELEKNNYIIPEKYECTRNGLLTDEYRFEILCKNGFAGPELGKLVITGIKPVMNSESKNTILLYPQPVNPGEAGLDNDDDDHSNRVLRVPLFEITYKIIAIPFHEDPKKGN